MISSFRDFCSKAIKVKRYCRAFTYIFGESFHSTSFLDSKLLQNFTGDGAGLDNVATTDNLEVYIQTILGELPFNSRKVN